MEWVPQILEEKRYNTDQEADALVENIFSTGRAGFLYEVVNTPMDLLCKYDSPDPLLQQFLRYQPEIPDWLDRGRLKKASDFYKNFALEIMMLLGAVSLPSCYAASPGNKVLYISEKIRKSPGKRLLETAAFIIAISEPDAFETDGIGYPAVQQVRLIHAIARYHLIKSGKWDNSWGFPANEEDMAGTNLAFSYTVLAALRHSGFNLKEEDLNAYLHLWKWVGYLMKIDPVLLTDQMEDANKLYQLIRDRNFKKSSEGSLLIRSLIEHYREVLPKGLGILVESQIKYLLGSETAEILDLKTSPTQDLMIKILSFLKELMNGWLPHSPSYHKMKKDHERLRSIYLSGAG